MNTTWIVLIVVAVVALLLISMYNGLISLRNRVKEAQSDMEVQMKRRYDLIPNLVETVKAYAAHEKTTLEDVINTRNMAMNAAQTGDMRVEAQAENSFSSALKSIFALAESYPDLKANQNFLELQKELTDTEDKMMASRRFYNGIVRNFNTKVQVFPTNIFAKILGFTMAEFFEIENDVEKEPVKVSF